MDEELDLVTFEDDDGNEITMEVLDYFFYEGKEYALLTVYDEEAKAPADGDEVDSYIMEVVPVGDEDEEFVMVPEELEEKLIELIQNGLFADDTFEDEEE